MLEHKPVHSSTEISKRIADYLEACDCANALPGKRCKMLLAINDVLQNRSTQSVEEILAILDAKNHSGLEERLDRIRSDISAFLHQKALLDRPYINISTNGKGFRYAIFDADSEHSLKVIDQKLYDHAAEHGFPAGFFQHSYFDHVTFYCLPEGVKFYRSLLQGCSFAVCRIENVSFDWATIYDTVFHTCRLHRTSFYLATLANTRFEDSFFSFVSFAQARMKSCTTVNSSLDQIKFTETVMDGCSYGRITASSILHLETAVITQGGATQEECHRFKYSVLQELSGNLLHRHLEKTGGIV